MRRLLLSAGLIWAAACQAAPTLPGPAFPIFDTPEALAAACDKGLAQAKSELRAVERARPDGRWLRSYDDFQTRMEDASSPLFFMAHVHPDKAMRSAAEACELRWQDFQSTLNQNPAIYRALRALKPADAIDRLARKDLLDTLEDAGVGLAPAQRKRAKTMLDRLAALQLDFERNIRDDPTKLPFTPSELDGVPESVWTKAPRDSEGRVLLGLDYPTMFPVLEGAHDASVRERMWRARSRQGGEANLKLLAEIATLRRQYAALFGQRSFAEFELRRAMAGTPARANAFLAEVKSVVRQSELAELEVLRQAKAEHLNQPLADVKLAHWDTRYYKERVRRARYAVDQEAFRPYFPPQQSLAFVMRVIERMMGVRYTRVPDAATWHPDVQAYAVSDAGTGRALATLYIDPYPRDGKYHHAAVWPLRSGSAATGRLPLAALVVNVDRKGLSLDELETLLHEFGHAVHNNLSATRYAMQSGTSVKRDFVEAPSQMLEDWVYDRRALTVFQEVCPDCRPVPDELLARAVQARDFGKGGRYAGQYQLATFDQRLYAREARDPLALWKELSADTPLGYVAGDIFPAAFSHTATHYGARYYGYLWSEVMAMDMRTAFVADMLDAKVGRRYRDVVLANGSQRAPDELLRQFLGRPSNSKAFFDYLRK